VALGIAAIAALTVAPHAGAAVKGFKYGVAAGDVTDSSAILWAKANKSGDALVQLSEAGGFGRCDLDDAPGKLKVEAKNSHDNTVQKKVTGLDPNTGYAYRFCMEGGAKSATGKFETAPDPKSNEKITFAMSGDQDARPQGGAGYEESGPFWNDFEIWNAIRKQKNDFNVLLGDTIYSDTEVPGYGLDDVALTKQQKWAAYRTNLAMKPWAKARGSAAYYPHWDDHEFINDFSPAEDTFPLGVGTVNMDGEQLYKNGVKAFTDYNPITYSKRNGIYRSVRWGRNLELFFLDARSFRSPGADYQGNCDNPPGSGDPDLAPTAPQQNRQVFAGVAPQLSNPPPPQCVAAINDPSRTYLGRRQMERFKKEVESSTATFKVIMNELPIQQYYALPYDRWEGYEAERQELLRHLRDNVDNVVFLTADVHANLVNDARFRTLESGGPENSGILDVTTGPIATAPYALEISDAIGNQSGGILIHDFFFKRQPPDGPGMQCAAMDVFSYAEVTVTKKELTVDLLDANDQPVKDTADRDQAAAAPACAQVVIPKQ
jgi:alkaline phosphatase D